MDLAAFISRGTINGTNGTTQVGVVGGLQGVASAWRGTAESWINLHALLPPEWGANLSVAKGIDEVGNIVGTIYVPDVGPRAVMWVVPEPSSVAALAAGLGLLAMRRRKKSK